jgi:KaiC/GvpD/RAD55 family RecA-like ATPase
MSDTQTQFRPVIDDNLFLREEAQLYAPGSERAILALIVKCPQLIVEVERLIPVEWFMGELNIRMYKILLFVYGYCTTNGWPLAFDAVTVLNVARQMGPQYEASFCRNMDGLDKWNQLVEFAKYVALDALPQHLATLREAAAQVLTFRLLRDTRKTITSGIDNFMGPLMMGLDKIRQACAGVAEPTLLDGAKAFLDDDSYSRRISISTFPRFSQLLGGFRPGSLTIMAGRTKAGKSVFIAKSSLGLARSGIPVLYLDSEMDSLQVGGRKIQMISGLTERELHDPANAARRDTALAQMSEISKLVDYRVVAGMTTDQICMAINDFRQKIGNGTRGIVILDWLRVMDANDTRTPEHVALGRITTALKTVAGQTGLAIIAATQQSRAAIGATHTQKKNDAVGFIAGSDRIAQLSSALCHIRAVDEAMADAILERFGSVRFTTIISIDANRHGEGHLSVPAMFDGSRMLLEEIDDPEVTEFLATYSEKKKKQTVRLRAIDANGM